jgi:hypothetical protein
VLARYPEIKGRVFLEDVAETLKGAPHVQGMETIAVDFFKEQPVKGMHCQLYLELTNKQ